MDRLLQASVAKPIIIHVNRQHIAANIKDGGSRPVYTIKYRGETIYVHEVEIEGKTKAVYDGRQLNCGARAWLLVHDGSANLLDACTFGEAKNQL